jgi:hypothetical protein
MVGSPPPLPVGPPSGRLLVLDGGLGREAFDVPHGGPARRLADVVNGEGAYGQVLAASGAVVRLVDLRTGAAIWRLQAPAAVGAPRVGPDGERFAFVAGRRLYEAVYATRRLRVLGAAAAVAPAWRPFRAPTVAWARPDGTVVAHDFTGRLFVRARPVRRPVAIAWSGDGASLLVAGRTRLSAVAGPHRWSLTFGGGALVSLRAVPRSSVVVVHLVRRDGSDVVASVDADAARPTLRTITRRGGLIGPAVPSPGGRYVAVAQRGSGRILIVPLRGGRASTIGNPARSGVVAGWQP